MSHLCIFEDQKATNFLPLVHFRPVFDLRCGITTLREKIKHRFPNQQVHLACRDTLTDVMKERVPSATINHPEQMAGHRVILVNGRLWINAALESLSTDFGEAWFVGDEIAVACIRSEDTAGIVKHLHAPTGTELVEAVKACCKSHVLDATLLEYPWHLVNRVGPAITEDFRQLVSGSSSGQLMEGAFIVGGDVSHVHVGEGSRVWPGCVLDVTEGPIFIGKKVRIRPPSYLAGPTCIGDGSLIDGAEVRENSSIGPVCKIGGEVADVVFHAYSNKHHDGFVGHAYVCEWCNLGALTTNSDLKNNYGPVKVQLRVGEPLVNTGETFVGSILGDHVKTGIGTLLNTGSIIGSCSNLFGGSTLPPKFVPSFSWGGGRSFVEYQVEKAVETARVVMKRRKIELSQAEEALIREVYEMTAKDREIAKVLPVGTGGKDD